MLSPLQEPIQKYGEAELEGKAGSEEKALETAFELLEGKVGSVVDAVDTDDSIAKGDKKGKKRERLIRIRDRLLRLQLIIIELPNEEDAYVIFETLNTRGKDLGVGDLMKNHLTRLLRPKNKGVDAARDKWNKIRTTLDESAIDLDIDRFIYHSWISRYAYVGRASVFRDARRTITSKKIGNPSWMIWLVTPRTTGLCSSPRPISGRRKRGRSPTHSRP